MRKKLVQKKRSICMVGTLVPEQLFNRIQQSSKVKAAGSPVFMQKQIYQSLYQEGEDISVYSYPPVASYPGGVLAGTMGGRKELEEGLPIRMIPMINIIGLKQITVFISMCIALSGWSLKNKGKQRIILAYADFPEYCLPAIIVSKILRNRTVLYLTELPGYEHYLNQKAGLKDRLVIASEKLKKKSYQYFDGYILVSEALAEIVNSGNSPWSVVEAFADRSLFEGSGGEKERKKTVMYAGSMGAAYNICMLIDAFHSIEGDYVLWLYGNGKYVEYVKKMAQIDPRIIYFGTVDRKKVLEAEKRAHLLVHAKTPEDLHSRYCFSSKIMEYMASGTPVLTTKVGGIPEEYYQYTYCVEKATSIELAKSITNALNLPLQELEKKGELAREFVYREKNMQTQAKKIIQVFQCLQN